MHYKNVLIIIRENYVDASIYLADVFACKQKMNKIGINCYTWNKLSCFTYLKKVNNSTA